MELTSTPRIKWVLAVVEGYKLRMFLYFILELMSILTSLVFIFYSKRTIDIALNVLEGNLQQNLYFVIASALLGIFLKTCSQWVNQKTQVSMLLDLQYNVLEKQMLSVWQVIKKWDTGDLLVRLNSDCSEIVQLLSTTWISFVITCIKIIASFIFLYSMDSMLAWIILGITPLFLLSKLYFRRMRILNVNVKKSESFLGSILQENLRYRAILRGLGVLINRLNYFKNTQNEYAKLRFKYINFSISSQVFMRTCLTVGYLVAFTWGVYKLRSAEITFGTMTAFLQLVNQIQSPILALGAFFPAFIRFKVSFDRIKEILQVPQEPLTENISPIDIKEIKCENVSFKYEEDVIIKNLSVSFRKGNIIAVVGTSGKGKTTLIRLLLGLIKPNSGAIYVKSDAGNNLLSHAHIGNIAYVPQGNTLIMGTIKDNITLGQVYVKEHDLTQAIEVACAEFIYDLPEGLNTRVGESGQGLSEGQAQRIAIARALLTNKKVLLFDEATSALDAETTKLFLSRIKYLIKDKIVIFVTHDYLVTVTCDQQLLMD